jgi:hypothetical protein
VDQPVIGLARRSPFVRWAMSDLADRYGQSIVFAVADRDACAAGNIPYEPDMVLCAWPDLTPFAVIHAGLGLRHVEILQEPGV